MFKRARVRLTLWYAAASVAVLIVLGVGAGIQLARSLDEQLDDGLRAAVAEWRATGTPPPAPSLPVAPPAPSFDRDNTFLVVFRADGSVAVNSTGVPVQALTALLPTTSVGGRRPQFAVTAVGGARTRVLVEPVLARDGTVETVVAGRSLAERDAALRNLVVTLALAGMVGLGLSVGGGYLLSGRALAPLVEAYDRQRRFVSDASHELRAPITVIQTASELLLQEEVDPAKRASVEEIRDVAAEAGRLVAQLVALARLQDAPRHGAPPAALDMSGAVEEEIRRLAPLLEQRDTHVTTDHRPAFVRVTSDELHRIVRSLLENVLAHTPPGTSVRVSTGTTGDTAHLLCEDDGPGIPPEHHASIFDRFTRVDAARTPGAESGSGLGLAIVREIVISRGGSVTASAAETGGLRVAITFPAAQDAR